MWILMSFSLVFLVHFEFTFSYFILIFAGLVSIASFGIFYTGISLKIPLIKHLFTVGEISVIEKCISTIRRNT